MNTVLILTLIWSALVTWGCVVGMRGSGWRVNPKVAPRITRMYANFFRSFLIRVH